MWILPDLRQVAKTIIHDKLFVKKCTLMRLIFSDRIFGRSWKLGTLEFGLKDFPNYNQPFSFKKIIRGNHANLKQFGLNEDPLKTSNTVIETR